MSRFIIRCIIFFVVFFLLDKGLILLRDKLPERELDRRLEYVITGWMDADIVVIGSSRGARDVIASQISDSLNPKAYNLCYPGSDVQFHEYLTEQLISNGNKKPKLLVIVVDNPLELKNDPTLVFRFDRLYPLVKYDCVRKTLIEKGDKNRFLSKMFVIQQLSVANFDPRKKKFNPQDSLFKDGSMPISWQSKKFNRTFCFEPIVYSKQQEIPDKVQSLRNIIGMCRKNNIIVLLACAPNFSKPSIGFAQRISELAGRNNYVMEYDTTNAVYRNAEYYFDDAHLKLNGATVYTSEISAFIKKHNLLN